MKTYHKIMALGFLFMTFNGLAQSAKQKAISEIMAAEKAFEKMATENGIREAFVFYADDNAIIKRGNDSLIYGKTGISNFYAGEVFKKAKLTWTADLADASECGDMGYTVGKYHWLLRASNGTVESESRGIFQTIWKKQPDGAWKFVWD